MECSVVSLAHHLYLDRGGKIVHAGIAIGSVAPTIMFVHSASNFLIGKRISSIRESESVEFAKKVLEYANPISDIRASAWYRKEVLYNISKNLFDQF
jgi:CO/xanthine dehydrogenase FAD-binding subunit